MNRLRMAAFGILALLGTHASAQVTLTQWGVSASTAWGDCTLAWPCNVVGQSLWGPPILSEPQPLAQPGGLNQTFADTLLVQEVHDTFDYPYNVDMGTARAQVQLDNTNVSVPVLKAKALSNSHDGWVSATAFGVQGYKFTGTSPTQISLDASLTGTIVNDADTTYALPVSDVTGFSVGVWLLVPDPGTFPTDPAATLGELVSALTQPVTNVVSEWYPASNQFVAFNATGNVDEGPLALLTINLNPGDEFYLMAGLTASATGIDRSADAFGTLTLNFNSTELLPAGVAAVPEPETYAMMLVGIGLVGWQLQRKSRHSRARRLR